MPSADTTEKEATPVAKAEKKLDAPRATLAELRAKKRQERELPFMVNGEERSFLFRATSAKEYDRLITECPPNVEQRANGQSYNVNKFAPKLLSRVIAEPELPEEVWDEFWTSPDWNRGELMTLFAECVQICSDGLPLGPTALV